jgi:hypothetical protein
MSLDWGRGFGTAFRVNSATELPQSLRNLCFVPAQAPPETTVRMLIDKRGFSARRSRVFFQKRHT